MRLIKMIKEIRVLIASTNDVRWEHDTICEIFKDLNSRVANENQIHFNICAWHTDTNATLRGWTTREGRPFDLTKDCDFFIGIFWKRLGENNPTATDSVKSKILSVYKAWRETGEPFPLLYFNRESAAASADEVDQSWIISSLKSSLPKSEIWWSYDRNEFPSLVRHHLMNFISNHPPTFYNRDTRSFIIGSPTARPAHNIDSTSNLHSTQPLKVFLCHSSGDKPAVRNLYKRLEAEGIDPWLDEESILPGQRWEEEIAIAVRKSDVVLVCLTRESINKRGYIQKEIKYALDIADQQPQGAIFLIPLKFEECEVPERLRHWQWLNYFDHGGHERLLRALRACAADLHAKS